MRHMDIVDVTAIGDRLGVKPRTVHMWRQRNLNFPAPFDILAIGPIWEWSKVEAWAKQSGRL